MRTVLRLLAARTRGRQASRVPLPERFVSGASLIVASLMFLAACAGDSDAPTDASSEHGSSGGSGGSGGAPGSGGASGTRDAGGDAPTAIADSSNADDDASPPCEVDPDAPVNCPEDLPPEDDCPDAAPSYTKEIAAIIAQKCTVCHRVGGLEPGNQFDTYAKIVKNSNNLHMLFQVYTCRMPKPCGEPLTPDERQTLMKWLVCGAPNNFRSPPWPDDPGP